MATRIVILGPNDHGTFPCLEIESALDASAMVEDGIVRPTLTKYGGLLRDATVLTWSQARINDTRNRLRAMLGREVTDNEVADQWWEDVLGYTRVLVRAVPFMVTGEEISPAVMDIA